MSDTTPKGVVTGFSVTSSIFTVFSLVTTLIMLATGVYLFVKLGVELGWDAPFRYVHAYYQNFLSICVAWVEPFFARLGPLPFWWKDGILMLVLIVAQWVQVVIHGHAKLYEAVEFFATAVITGAAAYVVEAANSPTEAFFFGIAGVFIQLVVRGSISFIHQAPDAEAWAGRYLLRSIAVVVFSAFYMAIFSLGST